MSFPFIFMLNIVQRTFYQVIKGRLLLQKKRNEGEQGFVPRIIKGGLFFNQQFKDLVGDFFVLYSREDELFLSVTARACIIKLKSSCV